MAKPRFKIAESDSEALEALRQWWQGNGQFVGAGLVFALAGIGGWKAWDYYHETHALEAAEQYVAFIERIESAASADDAVPELPPEDYADTPYLSFAYLRRAQLLVERGELAQAAEDLRWAAENALQPLLSQLAYVRLARVLITLGEEKEALQFLEEILFSSAITALSEEVRGDALISSNDREGAIAAYRSAWASSRMQPDFLRMKLEALGQSTEALDAAIQKAARQ